MLKFQVMTDNNVIDFVSKLTKQKELQAYYSIEKYQHIRLFKCLGPFVLYLSWWNERDLCKCQDVLPPLPYNFFFFSSRSMFPCLYLLNIAETYDCCFRQIWCLLANRKILFQRALFYELPWCMNTFVCCHIRKCYCSWGGGRRIFPPARLKLNQRAHTHHISQ